ncbi:TPA: hypothetical protein N0F65_011628, partial [Lagenidium giganteum]
MRQEFAASIAGVNQNVNEEIVSLKDKISELLAGMNGLVNSISNTRQGAKAASAMALTTQPRLDHQQDQARPQAAVPPPSTQPMAVDKGALRPQLRKMDTKPPVIEGDIDGMKLNSFIFQFEQYYKQKGYVLDVHGDLMADELNQSVKTAALVWYEQYMTAPNTDKTWAAMKQSGTYHDYVLRFRELHRVVNIEEETAMNLFYNGLSSNIMRENIRRTKPKDIKEAMNAGFLEQDIQMPGTAPSTLPKSTKREPTNLGNKRPHNGTMKPSKVTKTKCNFCNKGFHAEDECWAKHPEKRPKRPSSRNEELDAKIYAALQRIMRPHGNFPKLSRIKEDPGESTSANVAEVHVHENEQKPTEEKEEKQVKNENELEKEQKLKGEARKNDEGQKKAEEELEMCALLHVQSVLPYDRNDVMLSNSNFIDNGASINAVSPEFCAAHGLEQFVRQDNSFVTITMANQQQFTVQRRVISLTVFLDGFALFSDEFLILPIPDNCDVQLGMPWLRKTEKESKDAEVTIESFAGSPVYPVLKKHARVFQAKLPKELPPIEHGEHKMDVKSQEPVYRQ